MKVKKTTGLRIKLKTKKGKMIPDFPNSNTETFKDRFIDLSKEVKVYRNLNKKGVWYSIKQGNLVVARSRRLLLKDVNFNVSEVISEKVKVTGERSVHAYAVGKYTAHYLPEKDMMALFSTKISYNPYEMSHFQDQQGNMIRGALYVFFNDRGLHAYKIRR